jgi:hypothetical protein
VNWKASLLGAALVAGSGLVVGAAIGGKTTTKVVRLTTTAPVAPVADTKEATETTQSENNTSSVTEPAESTVESPSESGGKEVYLAEYLAGQGSEQLEKDATNVSLSSEPTKQALQGQTYQQAVVFDVNTYGSTASSFQMPTPGFSRLTSKAVGLEINSSAEASYKLTVYKNNDSSPSSVVLYRATFHGPSEVHKMDFALQGATDVLFVWTKPGSPESSTQDVFILADPILTR